MKKLLYTMLMTPLFLLAGLNIDKINTTLLSLKPSKTLKFYYDSKDIKLTSKLRLTSLARANIVLFPHQKIEDKMVIENSYKALMMHPNSIGAIYLKKGRTQIIFIEERLKKNGLSLPKSFKNNILSECQINPICLLHLEIPRYKN